MFLALSPLSGARGFQRHVQTDLKVCNRVKRVMRRLSHRARCIGSWAFVRVLDKARPNDRYAERFTVMYNCEVFGLK
jgi:hypothetical protein